MLRESIKPDRLIHSRLTQSVFMYIATCLKEGMSGIVHQSRLRADQTQRIASMSTAEFLQLTELANSCVTIDIDPDALDEVFEQLESRSQRDDVIQRCIHQDAPREMMRAFFGLSRRHYARLRSDAGLPAATGRHPQPSLETGQGIHARWLSSRKRWSAENLLSIAESLDVSLRMVWNQVKVDRASE